MSKGFKPSAKSAWSGRSSAYWKGDSLKDFGKLMRIASGLTQFNEAEFRREIKKALTDPDRGLVARCHEIIESKFSPKTAERLKASVSLTITPSMGEIRLRSTHKAATYFELGRNPWTGDQYIYPKKAGGILVFDVDDLQAKRYAMARSSARAAEKSDRLGSEIYARDEALKSWRYYARKAKATAGWIGNMNAILARRKLRTQTPYQLRKISANERSRDDIIRYRQELVESKNRAFSEFREAQDRLKRRRHELAKKRGEDRRLRFRIRMYNGSAVVVAQRVAIPQGKSFLAPTYDQLRNKGLVIVIGNKTAKLPGEKIGVRVELKKGHTSIWQTSSM